MATYTERDFYGSAIKGLVPQGWLDASGLRDIPDHQEVHLSPTTLTTQIFEINQYVTPSETTTLPPLLLPTGATPDERAALYHLYDLCDENDTVEIITAPTKVTMEKFPALTPAYRGVVAVTSPKNESREAGVGGAVAGSSAEGLLTRKVSLHYLLVRLEEKETDLVVFVNVPHEEFEKRGDLGALEGEEELARGLIGGLVEGLEVRDWGLFA
ncbi:hypothetical protein BDV29DRAFT_159761 [Aspergillus leporis]|uniref:Mog1p/PsbP-like protein n=1 Tax=Aspergillus leporis TaxID=41062 RepID=A0A5N5WVF7_9EURO|nr:hypothetical protein BDV29DRAFT_159761 [Aspergillus leporis]